MVIGKQFREQNGINRKSLQSQGKYADKKDMKRTVFIFSMIFLILPMGLFSWEQEGVASWYGGKFHGRLTANGEIFDTHKMTAAHKHLPFGTLVEVTNLANGKSVEVRINDRGPFVNDRIIDLSHAAADALDMVKTGTAAVKLKVRNMDALDVLFSIQVGAYRNFENASAMKRKLEQAGLHPQAELNNKGITRIFLKNIPEAETVAYARILEEIGITNILIKQN